MATGRGALPLLAGAATLTVLVGCTPEPSAPPTPAAVPTVPATETTVVTTADPPEYPTDPQEYADAVVSALAAPDLARLAELVTPEVRTTLVDLPGPPQAPWTALGCTPVDVEESCSFYNRAGDQLMIQIDRPSLGQARAATGAEFDPVAFPTDDRAYLAAFLAAWQDGNVARMNALAVPAVVAFYRDLPPELAGYRDWTAEGRRTSVVVRTATVDVETQLSDGRLGRAQAVVHAAPAAG